MMVQYTARKLDKKYLATFGQCNKTKYSSTAIDFLDSAICFLLFHPLWLFLPAHSNVIFFFSSI